MRFSYKKGLINFSIALFTCTAFQIYASFASAQSNGCGPEGYGLLIPDGPFTSACNNHDNCYGQGNVSQASCDQSFKKEMYRICDSKYFNESLKKCKVSADYYFQIVSNFGEIFINLEGQKITGKIISVSALRINDWLGDDEFEACITFKNTGTINTEYDLQLLSETGKVIDTEPDGYEINLKVGETKKECLGTNGIYESISDLGKKYKIVLRIDVPQDKFLINLVNDFTMVDLHQDNTP